MSERQMVAEMIADKLKALGLDEVYGVNVGKEGRCYAISFCTARTLDGSVKYYGPKFVQVKFQTAYRALPQNGSYVYTSVEDALRFIEEAFVNFNYDAALEISTK